MPERLTSNLPRPSIEIYPSPTVGERVIDAFGDSGIKVYVTSSPRSGIDATLGLTTLLKDNGLTVVPHIGAQEIRDRTHLSEVGAQIRDLGITDIFVVKGDGEQKGQYSTSLQLLRDLPDTGIQLERVGIGGYPEGVEGMTNDQLVRGIKRRRAAAESAGAQIDIVTQMCFDPERTVQFLVDLRDQDIDVPVFVGLPFPEKTDTLYEIAKACRVGDSKEILLREAQQDYQPQALAQQINDLDTDGLVSGFHFYTFNKVKKLSGWINEFWHEG